jgi:hypothetical protein
MGLSEVGRDPGILGFSTGKATGAPANGLITDSLEPTPGERPNPWAQLAISLHSARNVSEPIGSFSISGFETVGPWLAPFGFAAISHDAVCGVPMRTPKADQLILPGPIHTAIHITPVTTCTGTQPAVPSGF